MSRPERVEKSSTPASRGLRRRITLTVTLTDIMPTLRSSLPDPLDPAAWPLDTHVTLDDVVVRGLSMARAARLLGTPLLVHPSTADRVGVVLLAVTGVTVGSSTRRILCGRTRLASTVTVAADEVRWCETRLVGRVSVAHRRPATATACGVEHTIDLPDDLVPGDVIAAPVQMSPGRPPGCRLLDRIEETPAH